MSELAGATGIALKLILGLDADLPHSPRPRSKISSSPPQL
jgi:hypothetical protein